MGEDKKQTNKNKTSHANRGLSFEKEIEDICEQLRKDKIAVISKIPTDWKILRGAFGKITSAFPKAESKFVDFVGICKSGSVALEAKETKEENRFPFANIKDTQWDFFDDWCSLGGLGYYLIRFKTNKKVFLIEAIKFKECRDTIGRKSATYQWFLDNAIELDYKKLNFIEYILK